MIGINLILDNLASHALSLGIFEKVATHEYKSSPGKGLFCEVWCGPIVPAVSGLDKTSINLTVYMRIRSDMIYEPQDAIDPRIVDAVDQLMGDINGNFEMDNQQVRNVDLLTGMRADPGYLEQDSKMYRVFTITVPIIINDVWEQVE